MPTEKDCLLEWIFDTVTPLLTPAELGHKQLWVSTPVTYLPHSLFAHAALQQARATHQPVVDHPISFIAQQVPVCHSQISTIGKWHACSGGKQAC